MGKQDAVSLLHKRILEQENKCETEQFFLREQLHSTVETFRPINLIRDAVSSPASGNMLLDGAIGMTSGYIAKKVLVRSSHNPLLKLIGTIVGMGVARLVSAHPEGIKSAGRKILDSVLEMKKKTEKS